MDAYDQPTQTPETTEPPEPFDHLPDNLPEVIPLKTGVTTTGQEVRAYFDGLFAAEQSGEQFPVNMDDVWPFAFVTKGEAKSALLKATEFVEGQDFGVIRQMPENPQGGRPTELIQMTTECMEVVFARRSRPIFDVYRKCRQAI